MAVPARQRITIGPSRILAAVLGIAHAVALAVVIVVTLPVWAKILLGIAIASSCAWSIYSSALLRASGAIVELELEEGAKTTYRARNGAWQVAQLLDSSFVSPWLTVLNLRPDQGRWARHVIIVPDNLEPDTYRRVRVLLRWSRPDSGRVPGDPANTRG